MLRPRLVRPAGAEPLRLHGCVLSLPPLASYAPALLSPAVSALLPFASSRPQPPLLSFSSPLPCAFVLLLASFPLPLFASSLLPRPSFSSLLLYAFSLLRLFSSSLLLFVYAPALLFSFSSSRLLCASFLLLPFSFLPRSAAFPAQSLQGQSLLPERACPRLVSVFGVEPKE